MSVDNKVLPLDGCANLISNLVDDFASSARNGSEMPSKKVYKVQASLEPGIVKRAARTAAMRAMLPPDELRKVAFDTRRINQETERVPRANLQYWNRSQQFLDEEAKNRIKSLAKLIKPLEMIRDKYGHHPEYFQSYARSLHDSVKRAIKVDEEELDIFRPQIDYLEQLLFARYRLSLEDLQKKQPKNIYDQLIKRDEDLIRRDAYLKVTNDAGDDGVKQSSFSLGKDGNGLNATTQDSIINAIFGNKDLRRDGEKKVERTITITIKDEVVE
jgi:hypothetical protein